ncbi:cytochrome P450 [Pisolithus croceorrhizus]|nr:cytochrome P450 [Pisolithus croceorrhizus]
MYSGRLFAVVASTTCLVLVLRRWRNRTLSDGLPLPPGPRGLPLVGSLFDIDIAAPWTTYERWAKHFGGITYYTLLGQEIVIINDEETAHELMAKRSPIYSDRPYICMNEFCMVPLDSRFGLDFNTGLLPYGDEWRLHRKLSNVAFSKTNSKKYEAVQMGKVHQLLVNLLSTPLDYPDHLATLSAAIIMAITYGYEVAPKDDPFVTNVIHLVELFVHAMTAERATLINAIPLLAHIPSWLPGGEFKRQAAECRALARTVLEDPVAGTATTSFVGDLLKMEIGNDLVSSKEEIVKAVAATVFLGGAETTSSALLIFLLAMVLFPETQVKAQEEIDRVVGNDRLPEFKDRQSLPYVEAVFLEILRWHPINPILLPHKTTTADVFHGMYIPKGKPYLLIVTLHLTRLHIGATVLMNVWAMTRNEKRYPNPTAFIPERHLTASGTLAEGTSSPYFGLGRRSCPGRHVADQSLWASVVSILAILRIGKVRNEAGHEVDFTPEFTAGLTSHPKPFKCSIEPRSSKAAQLIYASVGVN